MSDMEERLADDGARWRSAQPPPAPVSLPQRGTGSAVGRVRRPTSWVPVAAAVATVAVALGAVLLTRSPDRASRGPIGVQCRPGDAVVLAYSGTPVDGQRGSDVWTLDRSGAARRLTATNGSVAPALSPDGASIAVAMPPLRLDPQMETPPLDQRLVLLTSTGGRQRELTAGHQDDSPSWSPDGSRIFFGRRAGNDGTSGGIYVVPASGGAARGVVEDRDVSAPAVSPDGRRLGYLRSPAGSDFAEVWVADVDGSDAHRLATGAMLAYLSWSPDSSRILFSAQESAAGFSTTLSSVDVRSGARQVVVRSIYQLSGGAAYSRDGKRLYYFAGEGLKPAIVRRTEGSAQVRPAVPADTDDSYTPPQRISAGPCA